MAGIIRILSHVRVFGTFQFDTIRWPLLPGVEVFIDYLGELPPEAANLYEIINAGTQYSLQTAEKLQQLASFDGAQPRYGFENRRVMSLRALAPVSRDRKTVRLVAHALNQM